MPLEIPILLLMLCWTNTSYDPPNLRGWLDHIETLIKSFEDFHIQHVYREAHNTADTFSIVGLRADDEAIKYYHFLDGAIFDEGSIDFP